MGAIEFPRRRFLAGLIGLVAAPAIVRAEWIMPVRAIETGQTFDPLVRGIRYQSWAPLELRPDMFFEGSMRSQRGLPLRPLSQYLKQLERFRVEAPDLSWMPLPAPLTGEQT